ncbi:WcaA Glycosyltransferases involved in cell wall biogenesis [Candidatus Nanopelagicaceae bacterium]
MDVLLATFNGEKYLEEQLESLNCQEDVNVRVWVNDDGSTDETLAILKKWQRKGLIKEISKSQGVGSTGAFLRLLSEHSNSEYVAFCDQDDIWDENKLSSQLSSLVESSPMMSTCLRLYVDEAGKVIGKSKNLQNPPSFLNSTFENIAPGNTIILNNAAVKVINELQNPPIFHYDAWIYLLIAAFGKVVFVPSHFVKYRIHSSNFVGLRKKSFKASTVAVKDYLNQQKFLLEKRSEILSKDQLEHLTSISLFVSEKNLRKKLSMFSRIKIGRQSKLDELLFKLLLMFLR